MKAVIRLQLILSLAVAILTACGGQKVGAAAPTAGSPQADNGPQVTVSEPQAVEVEGQLRALETSGALPALDRSAELPGPDLNNNGVRDDIEAWIATLPVTQKQARAIMQLARALSKTLTVDLKDEQALQAVSDTGMAATKCLWHQFDDTKIAHSYSRRIEAYMANTRVRAYRYAEYNAARSGSVTTVPPGDTCER